MTAHTGDVASQDCPLVGGQPLAVLVIDDDPIIRRLVSARLHGRGCMVVEAVDGEQALAALSVRRFHISICDLQMPGIQGLSLLDRLRNDEPLLRRIVLTASTSVETALATLRLGAIGFLTKPIDFPALDRLVDLGAQEIQLWISQLNALARLRNRGAEGDAP